MAACLGMAYIRSHAPTHASDHGGVQLAPVDLMQTFVMPQHSSSGQQGDSPPVSFFEQRTPGRVGLTQCKPPGQQYASAHVG